MGPILLTIYMLICPVIVAGTLAVIIRGFAKEMRDAKNEGRQII